MVVARRGGRKRGGGAGRQTGQGMEKDGGQVRGERKQAGSWKVREREKRKS